MTCNQTKQIIWDYYDDRCLATERQSVEMHLAGCGDCRGALDEWVKLSQKAFRSQEAKASPFLWTRVLARIEQQQEHQAGVWWYQWRWMSRLATAMTLLVAIGAGSVWYVESQTAPIDSLLQGIASSPPSSAASPQAPVTEDVTAWLVGGSEADRFLTFGSAEDDGRTGGS